LTEARAPVLRRITCLHGAESHSRWFDSFAREARALGIWGDVLAPDRSGWRGDVASVDEAFLWVRQAIAPRRSFPANSSASGLSAHDVVAVSWGGLAALASLIADSDAMWSQVDTLHLVAPGIFTSSGVAGRMALGFLMDSLRGRGLLNGRIPLALHPADFVSSEALIRWVATDPARNLHVSVRFLMTTFAMKRMLKNKVPEKLRARVYLHVPQRDPVINVVQTETSLASLVSGVFRYPSTVHALALEHPQLLSRNMAKVAL
jgi:pimeloyl-ACP methyl ester carboxylesterase